MLCAQNIIAAEYFSIFLLQAQRKNDMAHHSHLHWVQCPGQYLSFYWQFVQWVENHLKCYMIRSRHKPSSMATFPSNQQLMANYLEPGYHNLLVLPFRLWVLLAHYHFPSSTFIVQYCAPNVSIFTETWLPVDDSGCCFSTCSVSSSVHTKLSVLM